MGQMTMKTYTNTEFLNKSHPLFPVIFLTGIFVFGPRADSTDKCI